MSMNNLTKRASKKALALLPYMALVKKYNSSREKQSDLYKDIEELLCEKFFTDSPVVKDFDSTLDQADKKNKYCIIEKVIWNHQYINVCFISEVLSLIIWCLENGYKPLVDVKNSKNKEENLWERMFIQPFGTDLVKIKSTGNYIVCPFNSYLWPQMRDARDPHRVEFWHKMYSKFVVYNGSCQKYLDDEYEMIIKGKKVLGCLIRGIEYAKCKLKDHPIQPSVEEFISKIRFVIEEDELDYLYLATEDESIAKRVKEAFGSMVLENKRQYYDDRFRNNEYLTSKETYNREDGAFLKGLEYFSSINLLSKCDSFVAGLCGGSQAAEFFNGNQYKTNYLFDKGVY